MFETTVDGVFHTVRAVLPSMRGRGWGRLVLFSSGSVEYGMPGGGAYTKSG